MSVANKGATVMYDDLSACRAALALVIIIVITQTGFKYPDSRMCVTV